MSHALKWSIEANLLLAHNGDHGCPLELVSPPADSPLDLVAAWSISNGQYGTIRLAGFCVALVARWPGPAHKGAGTAGLLIDERANPSQAEALSNICLGRMGGMPFEMLRPMVAHWLEPVVLPFQFKLNGGNSVVQIGRAVKLTTEPIKNPATGAPESLQVQHPTGTLFRQADCASAMALDVNLGQLKFSWPRKAAFLASVSYGN